MPETIPYAQLLLRLARAEIRINDIPVQRKNSVDEVISSMRPIREFLLDGTNTAQFIVEPDDLPMLPGVEELSIGEGCAIRMRITEIEDGAFLDFNAGEEFIDMAAKPESKDKPPITGSGTFQTTAAHRWAWTEAAPIDPVAERDALDAFALKVCTMWAERDIDGLLTLLEPRFTEDALAYPAIPLENRKIDFRNALAEDSDTAWSPVDFRPEKAFYRSVGNGTLVEMLDTDGLPLVRTTAENPQKPTDTPGYFPLPMIVGRRRGGLAILL